MCLWGIGGDPGTTGIDNRPAGPSLHDDKALGVPCKRPCVCVRVRVCMYPSRPLSIGGPGRAERVSLTASDSQRRERAVR